MFAKCALKLFIRLPFNVTHSRRYGDASLSDLVLITHPFFDVRPLFLKIYYFFYNVYWGKKGAFLLHNFEFVQKVKYFRLNNELTRKIANTFVREF